MKNKRDLAVSWIELAPFMIRTVKHEIQAAAKGRLTHPQYRILANLHRGLDTVGKIALNLGVSQPAMSKMVDSLVQKGLVERIPGEKDRRQIQLKLSRKGKSLFLELKASAADQLAERMDQLSSSDQLRLSRALSELDHCLRQLISEKEKNS